MVLVHLHGKGLGLFMAAIHGAAVASPDGQASSVIQVGRIEMPNDFFEKLHNVTSALEEANELGQRRR